MVEVDPRQAWLEKKWGRFSASEEGQLTVMGPADKKTGVRPFFGDGAVTYIREVARQAYTMFNDEEDQGMSFQMKMGIAKEHISFAYLQKMLGRDVLTYYGNLNPLFELYTEDSGTSPDSVAWKDELNKIVSFGAELKNPSGKIHMHYLETVRTWEDLKKESIKFYTQCQKAMMTFKTDLWLWCSHNEYFPAKDRMLIIEIPADKAFQADLDIRIEMATKEKYKVMENLKNRLTTPATDGGEK